MIRAIRSKAVVRIAGALVLALPVVLAGQPAGRSALTGVVFVDEDGDGARGAGERGLSGVVVSDQIQAVASGPDGAYRIERETGGGVAFVSVPRGYQVVGRFWHPIPAERSPQVDFALRPAAGSETFAFVHASDTHISEDGIPQVRRLLEIVATRRPAFVLVSGDLVRDALRVAEPEARGYYELYRRETRDFPVTVWSVPGNHEIFGIERHLSLVSPTHPLYGKGMYRHFLGPTYYSFNHSRIHFIALDTVDVDDLWYYGHVDEAQLAWLERDLAHVPPGTTVVTFNHIPFVSAAPTLGGYSEEGPGRTTITVKGRTVFRHTVSNAQDVLKRLSAYRHTLALGGHVHLREQIRFESDRLRTRFHQTAAVVGPGGGETPMTSGVTLYRVSGDEIDDGEFIPIQ